MTDFDRIEIEHDLNDREADGSYSVWLRPGTRVMLKDGEDRIWCKVDQDRVFVRVVRDD